MRQRPLVLCPLMTATCQRRFFLGGARAGLGQALGRLGRLGQVGHDGVEVAPGPGLEGRPDPFGELVERQAALDHVLAQLGHGPVPVGVGHPLGRALRAPGGGGGLSGAGRSAMRDSLPVLGPRAGASDLTTRQIGLRAPVRLIAPCEASSVRRATCPTGGWPGRTSPAFMGSGGGKGTRAVASHDEDTTTLGVEAARLALRARARVTPPTRSGSPPPRPPTWTRPTPPPSHAALRLPGDVGRLRLRRRPALGDGRPAGRAARRRAPPWWSPSDLRDGLPTSADESAGGDAGAAVLVGRRARTPVLAEFVGGGLGHATSSPIAGGRRATARSKLWEERFGENRYLALGHDALARALKAAGLDAGDVGRLVVTGMHGRAVSGLARKLGLGERRGGRRPRRAAWARPARPTRSSCWPPRSSRWPATGPAGTTVVLLHLADGADAVVLRTTEALAALAPGPARSPTRWPTARRSPTAKFLTWRGQLQPEPPRRPEPAAGVEHGGLPQRGVEVRLRRLEGPQLGRRPPPAVAGLHGGRRRRRHGAGRHGRRRRAPSSPPPSTAWPTRRARPSSSPSSTSTAAAATRSS